MAPRKGNNTRTCALLLVSLVIFSQIVASHCRPLPNGGFLSTMHGRYLLSQGSEASTKGMTEGDMAPSSKIHGDEGHIVNDGIRPSNPGHSPGIGHAFVNKKGPGRSLWASTCPLPACACTPLCYRMYVLWTFVAVCVSLLFSISVDFYVWGFLLLAFMSICIYARVVSLPWNNSCVIPCLCAPLFFFSM